MTFVLFKSMIIINNYIKILKMNWGIVLKISNLFSSTRRVSHSNAKLDDHDKKNVVTTTSNLC